MAEEARFFLRTALYSLALAVIYWFATKGSGGSAGGYDPIGTVLLIGTVLACGAFGAVVVGMAPTVRANPEPSTPAAERPLSRAWQRLAQLIGFAEVTRERELGPLDDWPEALPAHSAWPVVGAVGASLVLLGLVFGPWLLPPGVTLVGLAVWGWIR